MTHTVFISHANHDQRQRTWFFNTILEILRSEGITFWEDDERLYPGDELQRKIEEAIRSSIFFLAICSPAATVSRNVRMERSLASERYDKHGLKIVAILIDGNEDDVPMEFKPMFYVDTRTCTTVEQLRDKLQSLVQIIKNSESQRQITLPPTSTETRLAEFSTYHLLQRIVTLAADLFPIGFKPAIDQEGNNPKRNRKIRVSLLWHDPQNHQLYIAAATDGFEDQELRWRFSPGSGVAGEVWASSRKSLVVTLPPKDKDHMIQEWGFDDRQADYTARLGTIISIPIYHKNYFRGILSIDTPEQLSTHSVENAMVAVLEKVQGGSEYREYNYIVEIDKFIRERVSKVSYNPIGHWQYLHLLSTLQIARYISPQPESVRAALFLFDEAKQKLFLLLGTEEFEKRYSHGLLFDATPESAEGLVGRVFVTGKTLSDDRSPKSEGDVKKEWNLSNKQYRVVRDTYSIMAAPVWFNDTKRGVLVVDSSLAQREVGLLNTEENVKHDLEFLASVCGVILFSPNASKWIPSLDDT